MRSLKKFMAAGLAAAMVFSMTACSSKPAETAAPETQAETTTEAVEEAKTDAAEAVEGKDPAEVKVGISIYQFADNFMTVYRQELER